MRSALAELCSETAISSLADAYPIGKPVKVRITSVDSVERRLVASIRQAASNFEKAITDVSGVEVGHTVEGVISDVHKDNVVLALRPTQIRALLSLNNLANKQGSSVAQLRASLKKGDVLQDLLVVSRNIEKGLVIVASRPKNGDQVHHKGSLTWDSIEAGQLVTGRVVGHSRRGATVKLGPSLTAALHPMDCSDDYDQGNSFPVINSVIKAVIVSLDKAKKEVSLSTRPSRMSASDGHTVLDREISHISDVKLGETVRGFVKSIAEHGLFVYVGRNVDARVQIKELFDDVGSLSHRFGCTFKPFTVRQRLEASLPAQSARQGTDYSVINPLPFRTID
jgi:rRNA biogenesis protein RRP5